MKLKRLILITAVAGICYSSTITASHLAEFHGLRSSASLAKQNKKNLSNHRRREHPLLPETHTNDIETLLERKNVGDKISGSPYGLRASPSLIKETGSFHSQKEERKRLRQHKKITNNNVFIESRKNTKSATSDGKASKAKGSKESPASTTSIDTCIGGICGNSTKDISLSTSGWGVDDTILFEGIKEDQVDWEVVYASRKTTIEGTCLANTVMVSQSAPSDSARNVTLDLEEFLSSCSLDSVHLHVIVPRTTRLLCFGGLDNCRPVLCSLNDHSKLSPFTGDQFLDPSRLSTLSYAPGNTLLLFGFNKDCTIVEPFYWRDYLYQVIGDSAKLLWSKDDLYRMDFDGDGLSNIVEYYGLRLGDLYADIRHNTGNPPPWNRDWPYRFPPTATDPYKVDTDRDLLTDAFELFYGMDPRQSNNISLDTDGEGLSDFVEQIYHTNPFAVDTDGDGVTDYQEVEDGTDPLDDTVFVPPGGSRMLEESNTITITLKVGDHSGSHSERYTLQVGMVEHAATEFGVVSSGAYPFRAGSHQVTVRHIDSKLSKPDYDYTALIFWPNNDHFEVRIDDPSNILGTFSDSYYDRTIGRTATLTIKKIQEGCNYETCMECNDDESCQWGYGVCDMLFGIKKHHTSDVCACSRCLAFIESERNMGLEWIDTLPQCPCRVDIESQSLSVISLSTSSLGDSSVVQTTWLVPVDGPDVDWENDFDCNPNVNCHDHPEAYGCLTSTMYGGEKQQCCYDRLGHYIPAGTTDSGRCRDKERRDQFAYQYCCKYCEVDSFCDLLVGDDTEDPGVRADVRGCHVSPSNPCNFNGQCDIDIGESFQSCPDDCPSYCGDGYCDFGETYSCIDCPNPQGDPPSLPLDPTSIDDAAFLKLAHRSMVLSDIVYYTFNTIKEVTVRERYWQYPPNANKDTVVDAALVSREYEMGCCIIALRGTNFEAEEDGWQVRNLNLRPVKGCLVREGWAQAFYGNRMFEDDYGPIGPIDGHYGTELKNAIQNCIDDGLKLVFTGHSQGGALALVGHLEYHLKDPISITFAAPPAFAHATMTEEGDPCSLVRNDRTYRFINTERDEIALNYDIVPFVREAFAEILPFAKATLAAVLNRVFGPLNAKLALVMIEKYGDDVLRRLGINKGPVAFLPPEADGGIDVFSSSIKVFRADEVGIGQPPLWRYDLWDFGLKESSGHKPEAFSAHSRTAYRKKVEHLFTSVGQVTTSGFESDRQCYEDIECASGSCEQPREKTCLRPLLDFTYDCDDNEDCKSGRCDKNIFGYDNCEPKIGSNGSNGSSGYCLHDTDCETNYCNQPTCYPKTKNGDWCSSSNHCYSRRCDLGFPYPKCKEQINDSYTTCNEDSDCLTGRCYDKEHCMPKIDPDNNLSNQACDRDAECVDGNLCDAGKCKNKLDHGKCEDHRDCASGRCGYTASKVCVAEKKFTPGCVYSGGKVSCTKRSVFSTDPAFEFECPASISFGLPKGKYYLGSYNDGAYDLYKERVDGGVWDHDSKVPIGLSCKTVENISISSDCFQKIQDFLGSFGVSSVQTPRWECKQCLLGSCWSAQVKVGYVNLLWDNIPSTQNVAVIIL